MGDGIYVALSGAVAQSTQLDITAQNLANASTDGYQRLRPLFHEAMASARNEMHYAQISGTSLDTSTGTLRATGRPLDVALPPGAFLAVSTQPGERYTRAGSLQVGTDGVLRTAHGDALVSETGKPIKAPAGAEMKITPTGEVWTADGPIGRMKMVTFQNPGLLSPEGSARVASTPGAGAMTPAKEPLTIGSIEESNASVVSAMTDLVTATRTFEAFQRAIEAFHQADQKIVVAANGE